MRVLFFKGFGDDELLKAVRHRVWIEGYTRSDGTRVDGHETTVLVSDHSREDVLSGRGSVYQREAHRALSRDPGFHHLSPEHRYHHILNHATRAQERASQSAAVSMWRQRAMAGQNPTPSQWAAFRAQSGDRQRELTMAVQNGVGSTLHLRPPALVASNDPAPAPAAVRVNDMSHTRRGDGSWESAGGMVSGVGSAIAIAADYLSGVSVPADQMRAYTEGARLRAAGEVVRAGSIENADQAAIGALQAMFPPGDGGPQDGEMHTVNGRTYVLRDGRWHRADGGAASPRPTGSAAESLETGMTITLFGEQPRRFRRQSGGAWEVQSPTGTAWSPVVSRIVRDELNSLYPPSERTSAPRVVAAAERRAAARPAPAAAVTAEASSAPAISPAEVRRRLDAVPVPDLSGLSNSETNNSTRRRVAELREIAQRADLDALTNFSTSRTRRNYIIVDDYRSALLDAMRAPSVPEVQVAMAAPIPQPPEITGANEQNTALLAARRKARLLYEAAQSDDPIAAILAVPTSRGNGYLNRVSDYKERLLAHFGYSPAGTQLVASAEVEAPTAAPSPAPAPAPAVSPAAAPAVSAEPPRHYLTFTEGGSDKFYEIRVDGRKVTVRYGRVGRVGTTVEHWMDNEAQAINKADRIAREKMRRGYADRRAAAERRGPGSVPASQNPQIAANPLGLSEDNLGFVPRPNVPLSIRTNSLPPGYVWPHPDMAELNRRYLAQSGILQSRARDYQAGAWRPETPEARAARAAAEIESRRREMEEIRAAAAAVEARLAAVPDIFKPRAQVGANISSITGDLANAARFFGADEAVVKNLIQSMVADYGNHETFKIAVSSNGLGSCEINFRSAQGTQISRSFSKDGGGKISVYHAFFRAGSTGQGSGKELFRNSMGMYKALGVSEIGVTANIDVGGYAWARFGYLPRSWPSIRAAIESNLSSIARRYGAQGLSEQDVAKIRRVLSSNDPKTLWVVSDMKLGDRTIGKELLLGTHWRGVMDLNNEAVMSRFTRYVTRG